MRPDEIARFLHPYDLSPSPTQLQSIKTYLDLLLRWNRKINLTGVKTPEECVTRHFGESLFLTTQGTLPGPALDVGSGAGFPGLALKIMASGFSLTLLEPSAKKRAFLKEIVRACHMQEVEVSGYRFEEYLTQFPDGKVGTVTVRGLGGQKQIAARAREIIRPRGRISLWVTRDRAWEVMSGVEGYRWKEPLKLPHTRERVILTGIREDCFT